MVRVTLEAVYVFVSSVVTCVGVQSTCIHPPRSVPRLPLFLPPSAAAVSEADANNRLS